MWYKTDSNLTMYIPQVWVCADGTGEDLKWYKHKPITCTSVIDGQKDNLLWLWSSWLLDWSLGYLLLKDGQQEDHCCSIDNFD